MSHVCHGNAATSDVTPGPNGQALQFRVECTANPADKFGVDHRVTINRDWSVTLPHDLGAERVGHSFGSWSSCLELVDELIPVYRIFRETFAGLRPLPLIDVAADGSCFLNEYRIDTYVDDPGPDCTAPHMFRTLADAWCHALSVTHLAGIHDVRPEALNSLLGTAESAWIATSDATLVTTGADGLRRLWRMGVSGDAVARIHAELPANVGALPWDVYASFAFHDPRSAKLSELLRRYSESDFLHGLIQLEGGASAIEAVDLDHVVEWKRLGLTSTDALCAIFAQIEPSAAAEIARINDVSIESAVRWLAIWASVETQPTAEHYELLRHHRKLHIRPPRSSLDRLQRNARFIAGAYVDRTELGVMLALTGSEGAVRDAIHGGVRGPTEHAFLRTLGS